MEDNGGGYNCEVNKTQGIWLLRNENKMLSALAKAPAQITAVIIIALCVRFVWSEIMANLWCGSLLSGDINDHQKD